MAITLWRTLRVVLVSVAVAVLLGACSGGDGTSTTIGAVDPNDVVFGSGSIPENLPDDFPVPAEAVISSTLVVASSGSTEMIVRLPSSLEVAVAYYEQNLEARGYAVDDSLSVSDTRWELQLSKDSLAGTITLTAIGSDITEAVMQFEQG